MAPFEIIPKSYSPALRVRQFLMYRNVLTYVNDVPGGFMARPGRSIDTGLLRLTILKIAIQ